MVDKVCEVADRRIIRLESGEHPLAHSTLIKPNYLVSQQLKRLKPVA